MSKKYKILVVSSKGGVGKSTVAMQIVAPYLYIKNDHEMISFYEFDDENIDSLSYGGSTLTHREPMDVEQFVLMDKFIEILSQDEFCCIDVGGNKSTTLCLDVLEDCGMASSIDIAIIPLLDGEQDAINAKNIYDRLKTIDPSMTILFALNRVKNQKYLKYQFENYFGDVRGIFDDEQAIIKHIADDESENYLVIEDSDVVKYSRKFGVTIYEIATQQRDFTKEFASANEQKQKQLIGFKHFVHQNAKRYYQTSLKSCFDKMDTILEIS
jgi:hypothetical protein